MRLVIVTPPAGPPRYFVVTGLRDIHDLGLKLCNEARLHGGLAGDEAQFVTEVCDDMDGQSAWGYVCTKMNVKAFNIEPVR